MPLKVRLGTGKPARTAVFKARVAQTVTDERGMFAVQGLRGGLYTVNSGRAATLYRVWTADTAPPVAKQSVWLVSEGSVVRGASEGGGGLLNNPYVWAGVIATAIAVPIAVASGS